MDDPRMKALERRVRRLESTSRMLATALVVVVAGGTVAATVAPQTADLIQVRRLQVVDSEGAVRIDLRHDEEETGLFIQDAAGDTRVGAAQFAHGGGGYALHGPGGRGAAVLYLRGDGSLTFFDAEGTTTARFPEGP